MPQSGFEDGITVHDTGSLDVWLKELTAKLPGAVEGYIYEQVKLTLSDVFRRTASWREYIGPFTLSVGDNDLDLNPVSTKANVIQVLAVIINGVPLAPALDSASILRTSSGTASPGTPNRYNVRPYDIVHVYPIPDKDFANVYVDVVLTPRFNSSNNIDQWIVDQYYEVVKAGVLERMYNEPNKAYTSTKQGEFWGRRYRSDSAAMRALGNANFKSGPQEWSFPRHTR